MEVATLHVVTVDMVVVHIGSASGSERGSVGMTLDVGLIMPAFIALMDLTLGTGVYIGTLIATEVEVTTPLPVGVGLGSSLQ